jgi:hypothetical protein
MWFLLLIALEGNEYSAEIVYKDLATCEANKNTVDDLCVAVEIRWPQMGPAS